MNVLEKAKILSRAGEYDSCGPKMCQVNINNSLGGIYHAKAEHQTCRIFKTLMDNNCSFDCKYCINANTCDKKKVSYKPEELARLFNHLNKNLDVNGLFLSSAVAGNPDKVTEKMIESVEMIRNKFNFRGYVHFKVLPGNSKDMIKRAAELSNRMSINIEAPTKQIMSEFSNCKDYNNDLKKRQRWLSEMGMNQATQMIVSEDSTDNEVLDLMKYEYKELGLKRVYYSAFRPVKKTVFENKRPGSIHRQNRLYNVDFLLRRYNYRYNEFKQIMDDEMLPKEDPKIALAKRNIDSPIDINEAEYNDLIRIPGIGPKTAVRIQNSKEKIKSYAQLNKLGGWIQRAKPFINVNGRRQKMLSEF